MPVFLVSALAMLAAQFGRTAVRRGAAQIAGGAAIGTAGGLVLDDAGGFLPNPFGDDKPRRRRRRRALTASDKADIGFIVGLLGPAAGKQFAVTIATRAS